MWNFLIILPDIHRKLEKLSRLISAEIEIDAPALPIIFPPLIRQMLLNSTRGDRPSIVLVNEVDSRGEGGGGVESLFAQVSSPLRLVTFPSRVLA